MAKELLVVCLSLMNKNIAMAFSPKKMVYCIISNCTIYIIYTVFSKTMF